MPDRNLPIWRAYEDLSRQDDLTEERRERALLAADAIAHLADPESLFYVAGLLLLSQAEGKGDIDFVAGFCRGFQTGVRAQQIADDLARTST